jgi:hypothetical protein
MRKLSSAAATLPQRSQYYKRIVRMNYRLRWQRENTKGTQGQNRKRLVKAVIPSVSLPFSEKPYYHVIRMRSAHRVSSSNLCSDLALIILLYV